MTEVRPASQWNQPVPAPAILPPALPQVPIKVTSTNIPGVNIGDQVGFGVGADGSLGIHRWPGGKTPWNDPWPVVYSIEAGTWQTRSDATVEYVRKTPTWAIILGVLGLFVFLIGIVFFFVKTNEPVNRTATTITATNGATLVGVAIR